MVTMMKYFYTNTAKKEKTRKMKRSGWRRERKRKRLLSKLWDIHEYEALTTSFS